MDNNCICSKIGAPFTSQVDFFNSVNEVLANPCEHYKSYVDECKAYQAGLRKFAKQAEKTVETYEDFINFISKLPSEVRDKIRVGLRQKINDRETEAMLTNPSYFDRILLKSYEDDLRKLQGKPTHNNVKTDKNFFKEFFSKPIVINPEILLAESKNSDPQQDVSYSETDFAIWKTYFDAEVICLYCIVSDGKVMMCSECSKTKYSPDKSLMADDDDEDNFQKNLADILDLSYVIKIPKVQKFWNGKIRPEVPSWEIFFNINHSFDHMKALWKSLRSTIKDLKNDLKILKEMLVSECQELEEMDFKITHAGTVLQLKSRMVTELVEDLISGNRMNKVDEFALQKYESVKTLANACREISDEKIALEKTRKEKIEDMNALIELQVNQEKDLKEYSTLQQEICMYFDKSKKALDELKEFDIMELKNLLLEQLQ